MNMTALIPFFNLFGGTSQTRATDAPTGPSVSDSPPRGGERTSTSGADTSALSPQARAASKQQAHEQAKAQLDGSVRDLRSGRDYVRDGVDPQLLATLKAAVEADPELQSSPLAKSVSSGRVTPDDIKQLQSHLQKKGFDVGSTGVDGKFGYRTNGALQRMLSAAGKASPETPKGAERPTRDAETPRDAAASPRASAAEATRPQAAAAQAAPQNRTAPYVSPSSVGGILLNTPPGNDTHDQRFAAQRHVGADGQTYSANTGVGPKVEADDKRAAAYSSQYAELKRFAKENGSLDGTFVTPTTSLQQDAANINRIFDVGQRARADLEQTTHRASPSEQAAIRQADAELAVARQQATHAGINMSADQYANQQSLFIERLYKDGKVGPEIGEKNRALMEVYRMTDRATVNMRLKFGTLSPRDAGGKAWSQSPFNPRRITGEVRSDVPIDPRGQPTNWKADMRSGGHSTLTQGVADDAGLPRLPQWDD